MEQWGSVASPRCLQDHTSQIVLNPLQLIEVRLGCAIQKMDYIKVLYKCDKITIISLLTETFSGPRRWTTGGLQNFVTMKIVLFAVCSLMAFLAVTRTTY